MLWISLRGSNIFDGNYFILNKLNLERSSWAIISLKNLKFVHKAGAKIQILSLLMMDLVRTCYDKTFNRLFVQWQFAYHCLLRRLVDGQFVHRYIIGTFVRERCSVGIVCDVCTTLWLNIKSRKNDTVLVTYYSCERTSVKTCRVNEKSVNELFTNELSVNNHKPFVANESCLLKKCQRTKYLWMNCRWTIRLDTAFVFVRI